MFNNAFSTDTFFYVNSESVALCSNSHTAMGDETAALGRRLVEMVLDE